MTRACASLRSEDWFEAGRAVEIPGYFVVHLIPFQRTAGWVERVKGLSNVLLLRRPAVPETEQRFGLDADQAIIGAQLFRMTPCTAAQALAERGLEAPLKPRQRGVPARAPVEPRPPENHDTTPDVGVYGDCDPVIVDDDIPF